MSKSVFVCSKISLIKVLLITITVIQYQIVHGCERPCLQDSQTVSIAITNQIKQNRAIFKYPRSVERIYNAKNNQLIWVLPDSIDRRGWEALLLLDCVVQFGLNHNDYHPEKLLSVNMHQLKTDPSLQSINDKAAFDVFLTDAIITFMKNLHYGKLNSAYTQEILDEPNFKGFKLCDALLKALKEKDFMSSILAVQPHIQAYKLLQERLKLMTGQYVGDCYEIPEGDVKKIALNLERLRWLNVDSESHLLINIPSYQLTLQLPDTCYMFRTIVGKFSSPTPTLESTITHLTVNPDWKVPQKIFINELLPRFKKDINVVELNHYSIYTKAGNFLPVSTAILQEISKNPKGYYLLQSAGCDNTLGRVVFRFKNPHDIFLHDSPNKELFERSERALSHGCIRVEHALKLAQLLLESDAGKGNMKWVPKGEKPYNIFLKVPVKIYISYITCAEIEGMLKFYDDVYHLDQQLAKALYRD